MGQTSSGAFDGSGTGVFAGGSSTRTLFLEYDFAVDGGAVSSIVLGNVPAGTWIRGGFMNVETALTGGAASVGITSEGAGDVVAVASIAGAPWLTAGKKAMIPKAKQIATTDVLRKA